jgi:16S rRNA (guanine(1405)-N(7))-methyltransferase
MSPDRDPGQPVESLDPTLEARVSDVATRVLASAKYRHLEPSFVSRVARDAVSRSRAGPDAVKLTKRQLHQAFGAFVVANPAQAVRQACSIAGDDPTQLRAALAEAMRSHASSAERVAYLDDYSAMIHEWCGTPQSVVDLACGLGPLAIPWLTLAPNATYWCCDIDLALIGALWELGGILPIALAPEARDLVERPPILIADLCLMLKTVTTLEQQRPGQSAAVLARLTCAHLVVSVPSRSLGGGRRYGAGPQEQVAKLAAETDYLVVDERSLGVEHYVHLVKPGDDRGGW